MGDERLICFGLVVLLASVQNACREGESQLTLKANSPSTNSRSHTGTLNASDSQEFTFVAVSNGAEVRLELDRGFELMEKYKGERNATVWVLDVDSGKRMFGTLYSASYNISSCRETLRIRVENATRDQVKFSLTLVSD